MGPSPSSALPPRHHRPEARPQAISGRTSYRRVRLAFHRYPQLIRAFCIRHRFGPPRGITRASPWPWVDHPVSGLRPATWRPLRTRFRCGSGCASLNLATDRNSPAHTPKGTRSPARGQAPTGCRRTVSGTISLPSPGCFSPFPRGTMRYRSPGVFSLGWWSTQLPTGFPVSRGTWEPSPGRPVTFRLRGSHPLWRPVPGHFGYAPVL